MCGVCGVVQLAGDPRIPVAPDVLDRMTDSMVHRGPNDRGTYMSGGIALGVRRLSIVDVAGGHQPVANENGAVWAVQNGELYNHDALRAQLRGRGHSFSSRCDTEILPHLYEQEGPRCVERLRGKFGLAIWDGRQRRALLARDRLGVKPLYYAVCGDVLVFGSELKSVLASGFVRPELDYEAIDAYLTLGFFPGSRTPLARVSKLLAAHRLVIEEGKARLERYWEYPEPRPDTGLSLDEHAERLLVELEEAVRLRLMSDVPLGAMLSGGLDSSLVVALMARNMSEPVKTFSVGFREDGDGNELEDARRVASLFGCDHHELELSFEDQHLDLDRLVWHLDEPVADLSALGFFALSELAARDVTVALSGQGADELLGGYLKHKAAALCGVFNRLPFLPRTGLDFMADRSSGQVGRALRTLAAPDAPGRLIAMSGKLDDPLRDRLLRGPAAGLDGRSAHDAVRRLVNGLAANPLAETLYLDAQLALVDDMLHYFDRASMAHSLEVRVPFLDHVLVEYCATIPTDLKVRRLATKYVLRHAARGILPPNVIGKRKIGFFRAATDGWLKAQLRGELADRLLGANPRYSEFIDPSTVRALVEGHLAHDESPHQHLILSILLLEIWLDGFLPTAAGTHAHHRERISVGA